MHRAPYAASLPNPVPSGHDRRRQRDTRRRSSGSGSTRSSSRRSARGSLRASCRPSRTSSVVTIEPPTADDIDAAARAGRGGVRRGARGRHRALRARRGRTGDSRGRHGHAVRRCRQGRADRRRREELPRGQARPDGGARATLGLHRARRADDELRHGRRGPRARRRARASATRSSSTSSSRCGSKRRASSSARGRASVAVCAGARRPLPGGATVRDARRAP